MNQQCNELSVSAYIIVAEAAQAIDFYCAVFGATEVFRLVDTNQKIGHAELSFGCTRMMIADEYPDYNSLAPAAFGGSPISMHIEVADVDKVFKDAIKKGSEEVRPVKDEFHGNRGGVLKDPFGHTWHVQTQIEAVSAAEIQKRWNAMLAEG